MSEAGGGPRLVPDAQDLLAIVADVVICYAPDGTVIWASPSLERVFGYAVADVVGTVFRLGLPDDLESVRGSVEDSLAHRTPVVRTRTRALCRDGSVRWVDVVTTPSWGLGGHLDYTVAIFHDVTDLIVAQAAASESEQRFRLMVENATDIVYHSVDGVLDWISPSLSAVTGWDPADLIGGTTAHLWHPDDVNVAITLRDAAYAGHREGGELRFRTKNGDYVWLEVAMQPYVEPDGRTGSVGIMRDVSDRVLMRDMLADSETRYRLLAENATDVVYHNDRSGTIAWISPGVRGTLGWEPGELVGTRSLDLIHPADLDAVLGHREATLRGEDRETPAARFRTRAGGYRWMSVRTSRVHDAVGAVTGLYVGLRDVHDERAARDELSFRAYHDALTGLRNRAWILDILDTDLAVARREGSQLAVLFLDLDNFKVVNDSLGHVAGDDILVAIARRVSQALRPGDRVGRFGGDEFVVIAPGIHTRHEVDAIAERICASVAEEVSADGQPVTVSASLGISLSDAGSTSTSLLRDADAALFRAKAAGRSRWEFSDPDTHAQAMSRLATETELRAAILNRQFVVHYQPIVSLADAAIVGYEALVRWNHPRRGIVQPGEFLQIAEETGLIVEIGDQVLEQVLDMLDARPDIVVPISVNKSPVQIGRPGWHNRFLERLAAHSTDPRRIIIEITETAILSILDRTQNDLASLRDQGTGIHVDDFGTGYSSIALLRDLPVTGLKLDLSFTRHLSTDDTARTLAAGLAGLAHGLHLDGIAEGIETREQADILREQGWTRGQGYLYGRPGPMVEA